MDRGRGLAFEHVGQPVLISVLLAIILFRIVYYISGAAFILRSCFDHGQFLYYGEMKDHEMVVTIHHSNVEVIGAWSVIELSIPLGDSATTLF